MKLIYFSIALFFFSFNANSQNEISLTESQDVIVNDASLMNINEVLQDDFSQKNQLLYSDPLDLNSANKEDLEALGILNDVQIESFFLYQNTFGKLIHKYELQSIPLWDISVIKKILPYVFVIDKSTIGSSLKELSKKGNTEILCRISRKFIKDNFSSETDNLGSPEHISFRYKKVVGNKSQIGIAADKDEGEQLFNHSQKKGFDFYSAHYFRSGKGIVKAIAIGDFLVNIGQGLIQWQSMGYGKGSEITMLKRQSSVLKPYASFGEINFERGLGMTIGKNNLEATYFASCRKQDANKMYDSIEGREFISTISRTGLHRTLKELRNKGNENLWVLGACLTRKFDKAKVSFNYVYDKFDKPFMQSANPYNLFTFNGRSMMNYGFDYNYTSENSHAFGDISLSNNGGLAITQAIITSVSKSIDISLLYRRFSKDYWALNPNAIAENSSVMNETGLFTGIIIRPNDRVKVFAYFDQFNFPWLKFNTNAPTYGQEHYLQVEYQQSKKLNVYSRYKIKMYNVNKSEQQPGVLTTFYTNRRSWRTQFELQLTENTKMKTRVEYLWVSNEQKKNGEGAIFLNEFFYKSLRKQFSWNAQCVFFETDDYDTRIYGFENDVKYSNAMIIYYQKGARIVTNFNYKIAKKADISLKWGKTFYFNSQFSEDQQHFNNTEVKLQITYQY